jgi:ankyrin repeat protein
MRSIVIVLFAALCASCTPSADQLHNNPHGHLIWAARTGDAGAIRALAASGVDLDASTTTDLRFVFPDFDHRAWTALQHAVAKHQIEAARALLEWGADPAARRDGATPIFIAATQKDWTLLRLLLDAGADLNRTKAWTEKPEAKNDGPLWPVMEDALARAYGTPSPKDAREGTPARPVPFRP